MGRENPWYHPNCAKRRRSYPYNAGNAAVPRRGAGGWLAARRFRQVPFSQEDSSLETLSFAVQTGASAVIACFLLQIDYKRPQPECQESIPAKGSLPARFLLFQRQRVRDLLKHRATGGPAARSILAHYGDDIARLLLRIIPRHPGDDLFHAVLVFSRLRSGRPLHPHRRRQVQIFRWSLL